MAKKFARKRWRRPERMTLEHPPVVRRKDIGVPDQITLETDLAWKDSRRHVASMLATFFGVCLLEGAVVGFAVGLTWGLIPVAVGLAVIHFVLVREFGDRWLRRTLGAASSEASTVRRLVRSIATRSGVHPPMVYTVSGDGPNAIGLGLRQRWLVVTEGAASMPAMSVEGMVAHEVVHLRDGDAAVASLYLALAGAPELWWRNAKTPAGLLLLVGLPLWPAMFVVRVLKSRWFPPDRETRADIAAAMITRYPPGLVDALRAASHAAHGGSGLSAADPLWFAARGEAPHLESRIAAIEAM